MRAWNYTRMCIAATAIAALVLCMPGCNSPAAGKAHGQAHGRRAVTALLDSAETMMNQAPEQAYRLLGSIDSRSLRSRALNARYALLFTEAQYKSYINETNDSLIMIAVTYYSTQKNISYKFDSFYCLGCIYNNAKRYNDAILALTQAEQIEDRIDDYYKRGLLAMQLANVYFDTYDFMRAQKYYRQAMDSYDEAEKTRHKYYALFNIGRCQIQLHEFEKGIVTFSQTLDWAKENNDSYLYSLSLQNRMMCCLRAPDSDNMKYIDEAFITEQQSKNDAYAFRLLARYSLLKKEYKQSMSYLDSAWRYSKSISDTIDIYFIKSQIFKNTGVSDSALYYYQLSITDQNESLRTLLRQPVLGTQMNYFKTISEIESLKASHEKAQKLLIALLLLVVIMALTAINVILKRKTDKRNRDYLLVIDELSAKESLNESEISNLNKILDQKTIQEQKDNNTIKYLNSLVKDLSSKNNIQFDRIEQQNDRVKDLFRKQFAPTDFILTRYYDHLSDSKRADRLYKIVKEQMNDFVSRKNIIKLDSLLNEMYNDIISRISATSIPLSEKEQLILKFSLAGLSVKSIGTLLDCSIHGIYKTRERMMVKIGKASDSLSKELDKILSGS